MMPPTSAAGITAGAATTPTAAPTGMPAHAPCWVGFSCIPTWTRRDLVDVLAIGVFGHQRNVRGAHELRRMQFEKRVAVRLGTSTVSVGSGVDENRPVAHLISDSGLGVF